MELSYQLASRLYDVWLDMMDNKSDPRTTNWFLMSSPIPTAVMCLSYAFFVKVLGPKLMENRKPFELRRVLIVYNFMQVLLSSWLFYEAGMAGWFNGYSYRCQAMDFSRSPLAMRIAGACWAYYISKFTEFFDTFFFIMRKRYDQVSTLHVIHHGIMPFSVWWGVKFFPGGHLTFFGFINTGVHVIMYTYYMLAAMGPQMQKYLWWKKYLTGLQMVQFVAVGVHSFQLFFSNPCQYPIVFAWCVAAHAVLFFVLFRNFYNKAYAKKKEMDATRLAKKFDGETEKVDDNSNHIDSADKDSAEKDKVRSRRDFFESNNLLMCQNVAAYDEPRYEMKAFL